MTKRVLFVLLVTSAFMTKGQGLKLNDVLMISYPTLKPGANRLEFERCAVRMTEYWRNRNAGLGTGMFVADRGSRKGTYAFVASIPEKMIGHEMANDQTGCVLADYTNNGDQYTAFKLVSGQLGTLPSAGILGIHYIKVSKDKVNAFEDFVEKKLNPTVGVLLPDLRLLYYKAIEGENPGEYILIFALESPAARDKYWPGGKDSEILKEKFKPLNSLARELGSYLTVGSYLEPTSGAAASFFESRVWTDFVMIQ